MISRLKKKGDDPESDSDWDSLPGDVSESRSSPDHKLRKAQVPSLSPVPPKQSSTHSKHPGTSKATNIYKNNLNSSKKTGGATTFEDKSGGLWDDDNDEGNKFGVSTRESNNNNPKENSKVLKEKKDRRRVQEQELQKRPPFTDFQDALSTPIPPFQGKKDHHELAGVNQAYRIDKGDEIHVANHDSWDDSENESVSQLQQSDVHQKDITVMKQEHIVKGNSEQKQKSKRIKKQDKSEFEPRALELVQYQSNANTDMQFENCCLIQVAHGPFHDRYRPSFYHGSKNHFHIREDDPRATVTDIAEKSEVVLQRFWREVFGVLQILINFFVIFILEFFKVLVHSIQNLITGILYIIGDHLTKPLLSAIFNNIVQPFSILLLNIFTILTNFLKPVLALTRELFNQLAIPLKAFRLFELNWGSKTKEDSTCTDIKVI